MKANQSKKPVKLHLGCGKRHIPGYVHVDLDTFEHIDYQHDTRSLPFLEDESAEVVYACHILEYFDREEVKKVLAEWKRVLIPGGTLRLAVPDYAALYKVYQKTGELNRVLGPLYGRMKIETANGEDFIFHKTTYDFNALKEVLELNGFSNVRLYDWRQTDHAQVDDFSQAYYPHMDRDKGILISLNVEATK